MLNVLFSAQRYKKIDIFGIPISKLSDILGLPITKISETVFEIQGIHGTSPVILGEGNDEALLGAITLEVPGFIFNHLKSVYYLFLSLHIKIYV